VAALLADFVLYEAARDALGAESFLDVNAVLWHARESFPVAEASKATATARRVRETGADYGTKPAADDAEPAEAELLALIEAHVAAQGFTFPPLAVRDYYVALKTKPFVILSGLSGTGKTRLTELMAEALTGNLAAQYRLLPVRPDWTDATPLLGFFNLLAGEYVGAPFLDLLVEADRPENRGLAFFVCLDEMNLARVEHYFADVLSAMEPRPGTIPLQGSPRGGVRVPPNLFITAP
jgi:MoxR-like ATPase